VISYDKYVELLSKGINAPENMTPKDFAQIKDFELAQPVNCPHCNQRVRSALMPNQILHDIEACGNTVMREN
jgi:hypothetical protein